MDPYAPPASSPIQDPAVPEGPKTSEMERVAGIFISPVKTLKDIAKRPTWFVPLAIAILCSLIFSFEMSRKVDWDESFHRVMERSSRVGQMSEEQIDQVVEMQVKFASVTTWIAGALGAPIIALIAALVYFAIIRMFGGKITYAATFSVVAFAGLIGALKGLLVVAIMLSRESVLVDELNILIPSNPGFLMDPETASKPLLAGVQFFDIFSIWSLALTIIGLSIASTWSRGRCAIAVIVPWSLLLLISAAAASLG